MNCRRILIMIGVISGAAAILYFQVMRGATLDLRVDHPEKLHAGEPFVVIVSVRNPSDAETVVWTGVELDDACASVESSEPTWQSLDYSSGRMLVKLGSIHVLPLSSAHVTLTLQPRNSGTLKSDVTVYSRGPFGMSCPAAVESIQTVVDALP